jgi:5-methylcytosine-specific restriction endonuclease McrA
MSNKYGVPEEDEKEIRARDKTCVYCHISMKGFPHSMGSSGATIEHLNNDGPFDKQSNLVICCRSCNSSRGNKNLLDWFKAAYCIEKNINEETVAEPVKEYIRLEKLS